MEILGGCDRFAVWVSEIMAWQASEFGVGVVSNLQGVRDQDTECKHGMV